MVSSSYIAKITSGRDNSKQLPVQQITYLGQTIDCFILMPYGLDANLSNDSLLSVANIGGSQESPLGIGGDPKNRISLEQGESAFYHPPTGVHFKWDSSGNGTIDTSRVAGNITIKTGSGNVTVDSPLATFTGDVQIDGKLDVVGNIESFANIISQALLQGATLSISGGATLGTGGASIARVGDAVQVVITGGSSAGTYSGTITTGGGNTST